MNQSPASPIRILLIEDDIHDQTAFRRAIDRSTQPFTLTIRERAEEIFAALNENGAAYDIVVIDYNLPGMNGLECYRQLGQREDAPPFVMLTGAGSEDLAVKALKAGMADYLIKDARSGYLNLLPLKLQAVRRQHEDRQARRKAQDALVAAHADLERLVSQRTSELHRTVESLRDEISERKQTEYALRRSERALRRLSRKIVDTQENERRQIARELHDSIGSSLAAIKFAVEDKLESMQGSPSGNTISLEAIVGYIHETIEEVRRISTHLRPAMLDDLGLLPTIQWFCRTTGTVYQHVRIDSRFGIDEAAIPEFAKIVVYRILQEAMNNALRHSGADLIRVGLEMSESGAVELIVTDNGRGMDARPSEGPCESDVGQTDGFGMQAMRDRAEVIGGSLDITSHPGKGTSVRLTFDPT